jgi:hypothetical protein
MGTSDSGHCLLQQPSNRNNTINDQYSMMNVMTTVLMQMLVLV